MGLRGDQLPCEQVVARAPIGFREVDERGVELYWLMWSPLYGQNDAGAIWNRTFNSFATDGKNSTGDVEVNFTSETLAAEITTAAAAVGGKGGGRGKGAIGRGLGRGRGAPWHRRPTRRRRRPHPRRRHASVKRRLYASSVLRMGLGHALARWQVSNPELAS